MADSILKRIADRDATAVSECLDTYGGLVWSMARSMLANASDAEDAVQEIFVEVWKNVFRYDPSRGSEATFIAVIARRRLIDRTRRQSREPKAASLSMFPQAYDIAEPTPPADGVAQQDELERVRKALQLLDAEQREVLSLSLCEGLSHSAIVSKTGHPLGTVKSWIRRGLELVRRELGTQPSSEQLQHDSLAEVL